MTQRVGCSGHELPVETQFLLLECPPTPAAADEGSKPRYVVLLPLLDGSFRASLQGSSADHIEVVLESGKFLEASIRGVAESGELICRCACLYMQVIQLSRPMSRRRRCLPWPATIPLKSYLKQSGMSCRRRMGIDMGASLCGDMPCPIWLHLLSYAYWMGTYLYVFKPHLCDCCWLLAELSRSIRDHLFDASSRR